jgi:RNA polymerase sigma factor (sigma-70 family)
VLLTEGASHLTDADLVRRFVEQRDETAFTVLVRRHGGLVLKVCRRILGREADAEDAFQATFLVLARNASSVRKSMSLASWLHGVAFRCASRFRKSAMRRRKHEGVAAEERLSESPVANAAMNELQAFLDEEIQKLPEKHRAPFILCCLEGKSRVEAAQALGWKEGTLSARLARARETLQSRLTARGVTLSAALCAVAIAPAASSAMVPAALAHAAFDAAVAFAAGNAAGSVSSQVLAVAEGVLKSMFLTKLKVGVALLLATCLTLGAVGGLIAQSGAGADAPNKAVAQNPAPPPKVEKPADSAADGELVLTGTVVDEAKNPVAGAKVTARDSLSLLPPTITGVDGSFRLQVRKRVRKRSHVLIIAEGANGKLGSRFVFDEKAPPVQVILKTPLETKVTVTDAGGRAVADANVFVTGNWFPILKGRTDALGRWTARAPADVMNDNDMGVFALKSKVGFDYVTSKRSPERIHLKLDGSRTLRVKTVDNDGKPIAGVKVGPWYIQKPGHEDEFYLSDVSELFQTTGSDGTVFDWLPERFTDHLPMKVRSDDLDDLGLYAPDGRTSISAEKPVADLSVRLLSRERISGRVAHADGRPAAGILVEADGEGEGQRHFRSSVRTDVDGRYAFDKAFCEEAYIVMVSDKEWGAPIRSGIALRKGKPVEGVDFVLSPATRIHGRVTIETDGSPAANETVWVGTILGPYPAELLTKDDDRRHDSMGTQWSVRTDADGRFEFRFGPGSYDVNGPLRGGTPTARGIIKIPARNPPKEIVRDFTIAPRPKIASFSGRVVDDKGQPIAKAKVNGFYASDLAESESIRQMMTDEQGRFQLDRLLVPTVFHVRTADRLRGVMTRIAADAAKVDFVILPVAKAKGRLLNLKGEPIAKHKLYNGMRTYSGMTSFGEYGGGIVVTDEQGRFELGGLVAGAGQSYTLDFPDANERVFRTIKTFEVKDSSLIEFGDLRFDPEPPIGSRTAQAFAGSKSATPSERKDAVLNESRRDYTRPLLLFGQPKDPECIELFRLFHEQPDEADDATEKHSKPTPRNLRWEFELASFDREQSEVRKLAAALGVEVGKGRAPVLAVLDADGKLAATYPLALDAKRKLDGDALASFLAKHKLPTRDAEKMLADALKKAKAEDKRVFFITSASWCGPCRLLGRFLEPWKSELNHHFVFVKFDISRDEHADAVRKRIQGDQDGGVPWYAILDGDGKTLLTSNTPAMKREGKAANIGFPSEPPEIDHFVKLLSETAPRLSAAQLAAIRQSLADAK